MRVPAYARVCTDTETQLTQLCPCINGEQEFVGDTSTRQAAGGVNGGKQFAALFEDAYMSSSTMCCSGARPGYSRGDGADWHAGLAG
jgi:hypothetical protein